MTSRRGAHGFTLLEVLVALSILGLSLSVILTSQTGLFTSAKRAAKLSQAVGLARCKMNEIEEELLRRGYQLTKIEEEGPCCEDESAEFSCSWEILPIVMPELGTAMMDSDAGVGDGMDPMGSFSALGDMGDSLAGGDTADAVGQLGGLLGSGGPGAGPSMGASAFAPMAMGFIYPQLREMLEASIRKVNLRVAWKEGRTERKVEVTQYLTDPQQGGLLAEALDLGEGLDGPASGATGNPGAGAPAAPTLAPGSFR